MIHAPKGDGPIMNLTVVTVTAMVTLTVAITAILMMGIWMMQGVVSEMAGCILSQVPISSTASQERSMARTCFVLQSQ